MHKYNKNYGKKKGDKEKRYVKRKSGYSIFSSPWHFLWKTILFFDFFPGFIGVVFQQIFGHKPQNH